MPSAASVDEAPSGARFKIVRQKDGYYKVYWKGWFFWHSLRQWSHTGGHEIPVISNDRYFTCVEDAELALEEKRNELDKKKKTVRFEKHTRYYF